MPETLGVRTLRKRDKRMEKRNWKSADATISVASNPGPPNSRASTLIAMAAAVLPVTRTWPPPSRPSGKAWSAVIAPPMSSEMKIAQAIASSAAPAARKTITVLRIMLPRKSTAYWMPMPTATVAGGASSS